jgi:hypothetical protein
MHHCQRCVGSIVVVPDSRTLPTLQAPVETTTSAGLTGSASGPAFHWNASRRNANGRHRATLQQHQQIRVACPSLFRQFQIHKAGSRLHSLRATTFAEIGPHLNCCSGFRIVILTNQILSFAILLMSQLDTYGNFRNTQINDKLIFSHQI